MFFRYTQGYAGDDPCLEPGEDSQPIWLDEVACFGDEPSIDQCDGQPWGVNDCDHIEDVWLYCS